MYRRILFLLLMQSSLLAATSYAQTCSPAPDCLSAPEQHVDSASSDWYAAGYYNYTTTGYAGGSTFGFSGHDCPTSPLTSGSLSMTSMDNESHGAFTCYKFEKDVTYRVCFWVRNTSGLPYGGSSYSLGNPFGRLHVAAANGLIANTAHNGGDLQGIDASFNGMTQGGVRAHGETDWKFFSATFTAYRDFNQLFFFPMNPMDWSVALLGYAMEYTVEVDDIRVTEEPANHYNLTVTDNTSGNLIAGCDGSAQITITGMPAGAIATWTPAVSSWNADRSVVTARPCSTTTYKIEIIDSGKTAPPGAGPCPTCIRQVLYHTITVDQWSDPANIVYPTSVLTCGSLINLSYTDDLSCSNISYEWVDPQGGIATTWNPAIPVAANATHTGEWTLRIKTVKGCAEEHKFNITVGSCCVSSPDFTTSITPTDCNPVTFSYAGSGMFNRMSTLWSFGDGTTSNLDTPIHKYDTAGTYTVCLTALYADQQGFSCCNQICTLITVCAPGNACTVRADYNVTSTGWTTIFDFYDASAGTGTICDYEWDLDGTIVHTTGPHLNYDFSTGPNPNGPWQVCLKVTNCVYDAAGVEIARCFDRKCEIVYPSTFKPSKSISDGRVQLQTSNVKQTYNSGAPKTARPIVGKVDDNEGLNIYPNPNNGNFTLKMSNRQGEYRVIVRDMLRREVYNEDHVFGNGSVRVMLNDFSNGIYSVEVINANEKFVQRISISR